MTKEERQKAKEYLSGEVPFDTTESGEKIYTEYDMEQAYIVGLRTGSKLDRVWHDYDGEVYCFEDSLEGGWIRREADKPKWHKLKENPNDLPPRINDERKISDTVWVHIHNWGTEEAYYDYEKCSWIVRCRIVNLDVIAWCEIPTYTEE